MDSKLITVVIATLNEEKRLPLIFSNLKNFAKIMVFDGGSTDNTEKICREHNIEFILRPKEDRFVVGADAKFVYSQIQTPYLLIVNCSHYYPRRLLSEFKRVAEEGKFHAVYHDVIIYNYTRIVHRPFFRRRSTATNFYRVDAVNFNNSKVHNEAPVEIEDYLKWKLPAKDEYSIHLFRDYDVRKTEINHSFYGDLDANHRFNSGVRTNLLKILWRPFRNFLHQYLRCGSILFGMEGFIYSLLYAQLELNIQFKIWELQRNFSLQSVSEKHLIMRKQLYEQNF